jgi:PAS domain S-box-containing protein
VSIDHPSTGTYVGPLERARDRITVLYVTGGDEAGLGELDDYHVETAPTGAAAQSMLAEDETIDCVVCDVDLPGVTGLDVLERVRADHESVPFVLLGEESDGSTAVDALNAGADGFFAPSDVETEAFRDRIDTTVTAYRSRRDTAETTRLLLKLTEYSDDALWMFTPDWTETAVINEAYETVWNRPVEDILADSTDFLNGIHSDDQEQVMAAMDALADGEPVDLEFRIDDETREDPWAGVRARPVYDDDGNVEYVAGYSRDITDHKRREESLASLNEAVTDLFQHRDRRAVAEGVVEIVESIVGDGHASVRLETETGSALEAVAISDTLLDSLGVDDESALPLVEEGAPVYDLFDRETSTLVEETGAYTPDDIDVGSLLAIPLAEYGVLLVATGEEQALTDFDRYVLEILGRTTTATLRRVERDRELATHREELERSNENLQQFAYIASHDLHEPLRMVASYVDLLDSEYGDQFDDEAQEYMEFAVDGARRMQDMVDGLLRYSRVQSEAAAFEAVESQAVFEDTLDALRMRIEETGTTVTCEDLPAVQADANQLGQVFQNLLDNAMSYAGSGESDPTVEVRATTEDELVRFEVSDNGPGVPEEQRERIFEVFSRGQVDGDGTGIGLAVCRRIVRRHGGEIWVESASEDGTTFAFTVPAANQEVRADAR